MVALIGGLRIGEIYRRERVPQSREMFEKEVTGVVCWYVVVYGG